VTHTKLPTLILNLAVNTFDTTSNIFPTLSICPQPKMPHMYERNKITATQIRSLQDGNANWIKNTADAGFSARYRGHLKKRGAAAQQPQTFRYI
jgi:hypothetical protein